MVPGPGACTLPFLCHQSLLSRWEGSSDHTVACSPCLLPSHLPNPPLRWLPQLLKPSHTMSGILCCFLSEMFYAWHIRQVQSSAASLLAHLFRSGPPSCYGVISRLSMTAMLLFFLTVFPHHPRLQAPTTSSCLFCHYQ